MIRRGSAWLGRVVASTQARDLVALLAVGLTLMLYWLGTTHPQFNMDSGQYLDNARKMSWQPHTDFVSPNRPPGYSLLMVLTGVTWLDSFRWLIGVQAALGLAIPPLIYLTLLPLGRAPALGASLAAALLPIPYAYAGMVMSEQLGLFLLILFVCLASRYLTPARPPRFLYLATLVAFAMVLTRPKDALVFWALLGVVVLAPPRRVRAPLLAAALYCALLAAWSGVDWLLLGVGDAPKPGQSAAARRADLRFYDAYFDAWTRNFDTFGEPRALILPGNGPASRALYDLLGRALREDPGRWVSRAPHVWFGAFRGRPDALLGEFFTRPNPDYYHFIVATAGAAAGPERAGEILAGVARECGMGGWPGFVANLSLGVSSRIGGASLFWEAFVAGRHHGGYDPDRPARLVAPENGPATRRLYEALGDYGEGIGDFERAKAVMTIENPLPSTYALIKTATVRLYGAAASDKLLRRVALEAFRARPGGALLFWDNLVMLAAGPSEVQYREAKRSTDLPGALYLSSGIEQLPEGLRREVAGPRPATALFDDLYRGAYLLKPVLLVACLVLLSFGWAGPARPLLALLVALGASQYAVVAVMSQPHPRYGDPVYLLMVMALAICAAGMRRRPSGG
ncbi:MAG TPA: hypothetical protein VI078_00765 [bacterium]